MRRLADNSLAASVSQDNAMTEVALALAMGFFSIMVLTLISMGGGERETISFEAVPIVATSPDSPSATNAGSEDRIVIYDGRGFLDPQLTPVTPETMTSPNGGRLVLAVLPELSFAQVADARRRFASADLVVTTLDAHWARRLSETETGQ